MPTRERTVRKLPKLTWEMFEGGEEARAKLLGKAIQLARKRYYIHSIGFDTKGSRGWDWDDDISDDDLPDTIDLRLSQSKDVRYGLGGKFTLHRDGKVTIEEQRIVEVVVQDPIEEAGNKVVSFQSHFARRKGS